MKIIRWDDPTSVQATLEVLRGNGVVMVQNARAFGLIAAPTQVACDKLDTIKGRPKGLKNYGFVCGHVETFYNIIDKETLPPSMRSNTDAFEVVARGSHTNIILTKDKTFNNTIVRNGTINGFFSPSGGEARAFFKAIETGLSGYNDPEMLGGKQYTAALATSCNEYHKGTIVDFKKATDFGEEKGIPLLIQMFDERPLLNKPVGENNLTEKGSYPVIRLRVNSIGVIRRGVGQYDIANRAGVKELRVGFAKHVFDLLNLAEEATSITGLYQVFDSLDVDNSNYLDREELHHFLMKISGESLAVKDSNILFDAIDFNGDNEICFAEFITFMGGTHEGGKNPQMKELEKKFVSAFKHQVVANVHGADGTLVKALGDLDLDEDGELSKEELSKFLNKDGVSEDVMVSDVELDVLFAFLDIENKGFVNFADIYEYLESCVGDNKLFVTRSFLNRSMFRLSSKRLIS